MTLRVCDNNQRVTWTTFAILAMFCKSRVSPRIQASVLWFKKKRKNIFLQNTIIVQSLFAVFLSFNESRAEENLGVVRMPQAKNKISSSANYNSVGNYSTTTTTVAGSGTISKCQHSRITSVAWKT